MTGPTHPPLETEAQPDHCPDQPSDEHPARAYRHRISRSLDKLCSLAVLQDDEVLYVGRSAASRIMPVSLTTGSRLPADCTALGRAMLAYLPAHELDDWR